MGTVLQRLAAPIALGIALSCAVIGGSAEVAQADATLPYSYHRDTKDPRWVVGQVTVDAPPDVVSARMEKVNAWPQTFSDISRMKVLNHVGNHWQIELETKTIPAGMLGYDIEVTPGKSLKLYTNRLGVYTIAQTDVRPGPTPQQSIVTYSMLIELSGVPSLLISEKSLHQKQEHMVGSSLADLYRAFAPASTTTTSAAKQ